MGAGLHGCKVHKCMGAQSLFWLQPAPSQGRAALQLFWVLLPGRLTCHQVTVLGPAKHILQNCPCFSTWSSSREKLAHKQGWQTLGTAVWELAADYSWEWGTHMCTHPHMHELALAGGGID